MYGGLTLEVCMQQSCVMGAHTGRTQPSYAMEVYEYKIALVVSELWHMGCMYGSCGHGLTLEGWVHVGVSGGVCRELVMCI